VHLKTPRAANSADHNPASRGTLLAECDPQEVQSTMRLLAHLVMAAGVLLSGGLLLAQSSAPADDPAKSGPWTGTLVDAACIAATPQAKCDAQGNTSTFGLRTSDGKVYKFDREGDAKAQAAFQGRKSPSGELRAQVNGAMEGDTIRVQTLQLE
jgi:hypothetical protein